MPIEKKYIALISTPVLTNNKKYWLVRELFNYLDDRHQEIKVINFNKLPDWIKKSSVISNVYYLIVLMMVEKANIIIESQLLGKIGLAIKLVKKLTSHKLIVVGELENERTFKNGRNRGDWLQLMGLRASDFCLADSEDTRRFLIDKKVIQERIISLHDSVEPDFSKYKSNWFEQPLTGRMQKKRSRKQLNVFFEQVN